MNLQSNAETRTIARTKFMSEKTDCLVKRNKVQVKMKIQPPLAIKIEE